MALGEAKSKAKKEFAAALEATSLTLDECKAWVEANPETKRPLYQVPHKQGVVGNAAQFVYHIRERMNAGTAKAN